MNTGHKHASLMVQYAQDAATTDKPWLLWQYKHHGSSAWVDLVANPHWSDATDYRRKPQPVVTYHLWFNDGSMSNGFDGPDHETLKRRMNAIATSSSFKLVKLTTLDGVPISIAVV